MLCRHDDLACGISMVFYIDKKSCEEVVAWCENITINSDYKRIKCPSNDRFKAKFAVSVIDKAISNVYELAAHRSQK